MSALFWLAVFIALIFALGVFHTWYWTRRLRIFRHADEVRFAATDDSLAVALHRYRPATLRYVEPLILCPGFGVNSLFFDLDDSMSLARTLRGSGFDVWSLDLCGHGLSRSLAPPSACSFDDHLLHDLPTALTEVRRATGCERAFWIGHSMGGLLGLCHAGKPEPSTSEPALAGLVAICSPVRFDLSLGFQELRWSARILSRLYRDIPLRTWAQFFAPVGWAPTRLLELFMRPGSLKPPLLRRALANAIENSGAPLLRQMLRWSRERRLCSGDGQNDYSARLAALRLPVLLMTASADLLAPPEAVQPAYRAVGSRDKELRIFGVDAGDDINFGHGDIIAGDRAQALVYPEIQAWLEHRATPVPS